MTYGAASETAKSLRSHEFGFLEVETTPIRDYEKASQTGLDRKSTQTGQSSGPTPSLPAEGSNSSARPRKLPGTLKSNLSSSSAKRLAMGLLDCMKSMEVVIRERLEKTIQPPTSIEIAKDPGTGASTRFGPWLVAIALFSAIMTILMRSMYFFDQNDFFYAASAAQNGTLYEDLHYVQGPLGYWFWRGVYLLAPDGHAYLTMRSVSAMLAVLALLPPMILLCGRHLAQMAFILGITSTHYVFRSGLEIGNYSLSLLLFSLAFCALFSEYRARYLLAGIGFGLAASVKLSFAIFLIPAALSVFFLAGSYWTVAQGLAAGAVGFLIGSATVFYYYLRNADAFMFHNIAFHVEITNAYRGLTLSDSLLDILVDLLKFFQEYLLETAIAFLLLLASFLAPEGEQRLSLPNRLRSFHPAERSRQVQVVALFFVASLVAACSPLIVFDQYLVVPAFILLLGICLLMDHLANGFRSTLLSVYVAWSLVRLPFLLLPAAVSALNFPSTWTLHSEATRQLSASIAEMGLPEGCTDEIFTLSGSLAIDARTPLSRYTEAGVFWVLAAGYIPDHYRQEQSHSFDPKLTDPMRHVLENETAYVLVGFYPDVPFEREITLRGEEFGFESVATIAFLERPLTLFARRSCR